jgi:beta-glucosidase
MFARRVLLLLLLSTVGAVGQQTEQSYQNPATPIEARVKDLLSRMTLEEKVAQMGSTWQNLANGQDPATYVFDTNGNVDEAKAREFLKGGLGQFSRPSEGRKPAQMADVTNRLQKIAIENTRLHIPLMFHDECLHGHVAPGGTVYPQAIALAGTWDVALVQQIFDATAQEARARGAHQCLMPVVDIARDPRWGRTEETYGEDPYLASRMGVAAVEGLQGTGATIDRNHVIATLKHFAAHSQPMSGTNIGPADFSERTVREIFLAPFEAAIHEAHARSVMPSYNELNGIPNHSNTWLLRDILRGEWSFQGTVVSDYFAVKQLEDIHHIASNCREATKWALQASVDIELPATDCYKELPAMVRAREIPETLIDEAVARLLRQKFELGLFDSPYVDVKRAEAVTNSAEHRQLALKAAHEAITLLKNEGPLLPLDITKYKRIAVIGPNAADAHLGGYSTVPEHQVSILQGIRDKVGNRAEVLYAEGCRITETKPDWDADIAVPADPLLDQHRIAEAVKVMEQSDVAIVVVGENEQTSREAWAPTHLGDRDDLNLLGRQDEMVRRLRETGKPLIVVLLHGRPNSIGYIAQNVQAILDGWYLGQEGGTAMADVIFGDYNPAGRLPMTVPKSGGQLPVFYYQKPSAQRSYLFSEKAPLFPFGFGLSYTRFRYSNLRVANASIGPQGSTVARVEISNVGDRAGDEVAQMYIAAEHSTVTRPTKLLKGFQRIPLKPGETRTVEFPLGAAELSYLDRQMKRVVEPGKYSIMVGGDSVHLSRITLEVVAAK